MSLKPKLPWQVDGAYGSCYGNDIAWTQASAVQNTWYEIADADIVDGLLNEVTHDGNGKLTVARAGNYQVEYVIVANCSIAGKDLQTAISINGTEQNAGIDHENAAVTTEQVHMASVGAFTLAAGDTIEISMRTTDAGTPDISCEHFNLLVNMLPG